MKLIIACFMTVMLVGCYPPCPPTGTQYRQVTVTPDRCKMTVVNEEPINMTTTAITYY